MKSERLAKTFAAGDVAGKNKASSGGREGGWGHTRKSTEV